MAKSQTEQFNLRLTPEEAAIVKAGIPHGQLSATLRRLILAEAKQRITLDLDLPAEGREHTAA